MFLDISVALLIVVVVPAAMVMDLCTRRVPNLLTFPLLTVAVIARVSFQGWPGLALAVAGALLAPVALLVLHAFRGLGMGDLKLAMGIGAALGPITAVVSMLATALIGGVLAMIWMLKPGGVFSDLVPLLLAGLPGVGSRFKRQHSVAVDRSSLTFPYGVAIGLGALVILTVRWCTEYNLWFL